MTQTKNKGRSTSQANPDLKEVDTKSNASKKSNVDRRSKSVGPRSKNNQKNKLNKAAASQLKKYFVQLMEIDELLPFIKPRQLLDLDTTGGSIQPVINL